MTKAGVMRAAAWAAIKAAAALHNGISARDATRSAMPNASASTPYAPIRLSFMIASRLPTPPPPPKPSAVSAKPSSCRAPVTTMLAATASRAAITGPQMAPASNNAPADTTPTQIPTAGKYFAQRDSQSGLAAASDDGTGRTVMNRSAFKNSPLPFISEFSGQHVAEIGDIGQEPRRRAHQRHREQGAGAFTEPQPEIEQRFGIEGGEQHIVALFRGAMREETVVARSGAKP